MNARLDSAVAAFLSVLLPARCPICGGEPFDGTPGMFCAACMETLPFLTGQLCRGCGGRMDGILDVCPKCLHQPPRPWVQAFSLFQMEGQARTLISNLKYRGQPDIARSIGNLLGRRLKMELEPHRVDWIVPVPLHWTRMLQRGYNQAELICQGISGVTGVPILHAMRRVKRTRQQAKLNREERILNLKGAFSVNNSTKCKKCAILIVDDVLTTGTTLAAAAEALLGAGAAQVYAASAARR